jgi:hypothetical protein
MALCRKDCLPSKRGPDPNLFQDPSSKRAKVEVPSPHGLMYERKLPFVCSTSSSKLNYLLSRLKELVGGGNPHNNKVRTAVTAPG